MGFVHSHRNERDSLKLWRKHPGCAPPALPPKESVCLPEPPLLVAQQGMQMGERGVLGPFLVRVMVGQPLEDRKDTV